MARSGFASRTGANQSIHARSTDNHIHYHSPYATGKCPICDGCRSTGTHHLHTAFGNKPIGDLAVDLHGHWYTLHSPLPPHEHAGRTWRVKWPLLAARDHPFWRAVHRGGLSPHYVRRDVLVASDRTPLNFGLAQDRQ